MFPLADTNDWQAVAAVVQKVHLELFPDAEDLVRKTAGFWGSYVKPKLDGDFLGQYKFLARPYPDGANAYLDQVEANIERAKRVVARLDAAVAEVPSLAEAVSAE